jgi:hypothetical protein
VPVLAGVEKAMTLEEIEPVLSIEGVPLIESRYP